MGSAYDRVTDALSAKGSRRAGKNWQCPAHDDRTPSLTVTQGDKGAVLHCHAGCMTEVILKTLELSWGDIFDDQGQAKNVSQMCDSREQYAYNLTGRTALTDRDVLLAVIGLARQHNSLTVICASRTISELSGVSRWTVPKSLARHTEAGALKYAGTGTRGASRYTLSHYAPVFYTDTRVSPINENTGEKWDKTSGTGDISAQAARYAPTEQSAAIGKRGMMLWCALTDEPATVRELERDTGIPRATVDRWLRGKLGRLGYAIQTPDGWTRGYHAYNPETDTLAGPIIANRKAQHRRDREQWARIRRARKRKQENPEESSSSSSSSWRETGDAEECAGCSTLSCYPECCPANYPWHTDGDRTLCNDCYSRNYNQLRGMGDHPAPVPRYSAGAMLP